MIYSIIKKGRKKFLDVNELTQIARDNFKNILLLQWFTFILTSPLKYWEAIVEINLIRIDTQLIGRINLQ